MRHSSCRNSLLDDKDKLIKDTLEALTNDNSTPTFNFILAVSYTFTSIFAPIPILLRGIYTNVDF